MNSFKINKQIFIFIFSIIFFISACSTHSHDEKDAHEHEEENTSATEIVTITSLHEEQIKAVEIQLGKIENKQLTATLKLNGNLNVPNNNKANATSLYGGVITSIFVQLGTAVKKGQVIARISNPQFIQLQEEYLNVGNKIIFAEQELNRQKQLNAENAGAYKNYQSADAELNTLKTRKASLHQQILLMGIQPNSVSNTNLKSALTVTSPINGTISALFLKIGSYVDVASPVAEIVDNNQLHLDLQIFEKDLPLIKVGQQIHFTLTNNPIHEYDAEVSSIGTAFESESKTIAVHCRVSGNKTGLIDGMNISAIVSLNNAVLPAVPTDAIVNADGKDYIFIVTNKKPKLEDEHRETQKTSNSINFEKIEVIKGVSEVGYTAITPIVDLANETKIAVKGAYFINAKMNKPEGHAH